MSAAPSEKLTPEMMVKILVISLGTPELRRGLDLMVTLAMTWTTDEYPWDLLRSEMGYGEYDIACVLAAQRWIERVTGINYDAPRKKYEREAGTCEREQRDR